MSPDEKDAIAFNSPSVSSYRYCRSIYCNMNSEFQSAKASIIGSVVSSLLSQGFPSISILSNHGSVAIMILQYRRSLKRLRC